MPRQLRKPKRAATAKHTPELSLQTPADFATQTLGLSPDPVQLDLLRADPHRLVLNCSRQWGKSTITAAKAVHQAYFTPESLILVVSPSARQSAEFLRKASTYVRKLGIKPRGDGDNEISLLLPNQSRIIGLPGQDATIRGFSAASLLLIDEASRVPDELYHAVRPMLAASDGQLWLISTPNGRRGFFYEQWESPDPKWTRLGIPATQCSRISPAFLQEERRAMPARLFDQEYLCQFLDAEDAVFSLDVLNQALAPIVPLFHCGATLNPTARFYIGVDLGQKQDYTAIAIVERATVITGPRDRVTYEYPTAITYSVRHLERLPLGTPYPDIVSHIRALSRHPDLGDSRQVIIDATGVGQPVVDLLRRAGLDCRLVPVMITGGERTTSHHGTWHVPRTTLLGNLEVALQQEQLKISSQLKDSPVLLKELQSLRHVKSTTHDDFVFATALAHWRATWHGNR